VIDFEAPPKQTVESLIKSEFDDNATASATKISLIGEAIPEVFVKVVMQMRSSLRSMALNESISGSTIKMYTEAYWNFMFEVMQKYACFYDVSNEIHGVADINLSKFVKFFLRTEPLYLLRNGKMYRDLPGSANTHDALQCRWEVLFIELSQKPEDYYSVEVITPTESKSIMNARNIEEDKTGIQIVRRYGECGDVTGGLVVLYLYIEPVTRNSERELHLYAMTEDATPQIVKFVLTQ